MTDVKRDSLEESSMTDRVEAVICGVIMPISSMGVYSISHWEDVKNIIVTSISDAGFTPRPVWESEKTNIIHSKIVQNIYELPIAVCDVSGKNPNVMFELGMRLAFDMPTIVLKDDSTEYFFDGSPIEYIEYPKDLRYPIIQSVKVKISSALIKTYRLVKKKQFKTFLDHFGSFNIKDISSKDVSFHEMLNEIYNGIELLKSRDSTSFSGRFAIHSKGGHRQLVQKDALEDLFDYLCEMSDEDFEKFRLEYEANPVRTIMPIVLSYGGDLNCIDEVFLSKVSECISDEFTMRDALSE